MAHRLPGALHLDRLLKRGCNLNRPLTYKKIADLERRSPSLLVDTTTQKREQNQSLQPQPNSPALIRSSRALGWLDIEVQSYLEPMETERWTEPVSTELTVILLTQGSTHLTECDRTSCQGFPIRQGDLLLKPAATTLPDLRWQTLSSQPVQTVRLSLSHTLFSRTINELGAREPAGIRLVTRAGFQDPLLFHIGLTLVRELENPSSMSPLYVQTAANMLMVHLLRNYAIEPMQIRERHNGLSPQHLKRITDYVQTYLTQPLSLDELAYQIGFSPYHFARLFRQEVGESPHQFVLRQRVEHAKKLLSIPELTIAEIAIASGFADQSHLTQTFKRFTGWTPKLFRQNF